MEDLEVGAGRVLVRTRDSDAVARFLLTGTPARDVEITAHGLEDAFVSLTSTTPRTTASTENPR